MRKQLSKENISKFALAGNATITLQSGKTGKYFTYKIVKYSNDSELYLVKLLHGSDNESDYRYIGCYYKDTEYFNVCKTWKNTSNHTWPAALRAIKYFFDNINNVPNNLFVYHEGKCARCGRKLTTPGSIERGFGPECWEESKTCN